VWWTVLAVEIAVLAVLLLLVANVNKFWWIWGRRPGD